MSDYAVARLEEIDGEQFRAYAKDDSDFDPIREEPAFRELAGS
jgi:hypothetical protein